MYTISTYSFDAYFKRMLSRI